MAAKKRPIPRQNPPGPPSPTVVPQVHNAVLISLVFVYAVQVLASFAHSNWLWGVGLWRYWPTGPALVLAALPALAFVPIISDRLGHWLHGLGHSWEKSAWWGDLVVAAASATFLFVIRDPLRFTGDFGVRVGVIGMANPGPQLRQLMSPLDSGINFHLARAVHNLGLTPEAALQLVGAVTGGVFVFIICRFLRAAGANGSALPAGLMTVCSGTLLLHFAGYNKFGPLIVGIALAVLGGVQIYRTKKGPWLFAAGVVLCLLSHRSGFLIAPAAAVVIIHAWRQARSSSQKNQLVAAAAVIALAITALIPQTWQTLTQVDLVKHLPGGDVAQARRAASAPSLVLKASHLLNLAFLLAPLWISGLAASVMLKRRRGPGSQVRSPGLGVVTWLSLGGFVALLMAVEPGGGWARDWDIATGAGALIAVTSAYALVSVWGRGGASGTEPAAFVLALSILIAATGVHTSETIGMKRLASLAGSEPAWSDATRAWMYDFWGTHEFNRGNYAGASKQFQKSIEIGGPNPRLFYQVGLAELELGQLEAADDAFRIAAERQPQASDPWVGRARVSLALGDAQQARAQLDSALAKNPSNAEARRMVGELGQDR